MNPKPLFFFLLFLLAGWGTWNWCKNSSGGWPCGEPQVGDSREGHTGAVTWIWQWSILPCTLRSRSTWSGCWSHTPMCIGTQAIGKIVCHQHEASPEEPQVRKSFAHSSSVNCGLFFSAIKSHTWISRSVLPSRAQCRAICLMDIKSQR
jgi:hypothetical protein